MPPQRTHIAADLSLLAITAVWGFTFPAVKRALEAADPFSFLGVRFALAALVLLLAFPRRALRVRLRTIASGAVLGLWLTGGYALQTTGLVHTTASKSAFITGLSVVLVPVLSFAVSRVRASWALVAAVLLAAAGLHLLTGAKAGGMNLGDLLTLGCAVSFALHIVTTERAAPYHDPVPLAFWQIAITAIACGFIALTLPERRLVLTPWTLVALLTTGILATAAAFLVQTWAQRRTSATHVAVIFTAEPVFAALFSWLVQREALGPERLVGGGLIVLGMAAAKLGRRSPSGRL